jgi:hypothetical protein
MPSILKNYWWIVLWSFLAATNTHIKPSNYITSVSALDTSIYLQIADAAPHLPPAGSMLVFHGSQRFFYSYALGLLAKALHISSWQAFQVTVHVCTLLTTWLFWRTLKRSTANTDTHLLLLAILVCHPFLFRLQLTFSGFVNDAIFNLGLGILTYALVSKSSCVKILGLLIMMPAKQTIFLIIPTLCMADLLFTESSKRCTVGFWALVATVTFVYYAIIQQIIAPFSSPNTTSQMAFGLWFWLKNANNSAALMQLATFIGRGFLGLLTPVGLVALIFFANLSRQIKNSTKYLLLLFLSIIAQPIISGPATTDASIQRLFSLGLFPLLILMTPFLEGLAFRSNFSKATVIIAASIGATHHLFSQIGPDLDLRYVFLGLYLTSAVIILLQTYMGLTRKSVT